MRNFLFVLIALFISTAHGDQRPHPLSAKRYQGESAGQALQRYVSRYRQAHDNANPPLDDTPMGVAQSVTQLDFSKVPHYANTKAAQKAFQLVRDERFIQDPDHQGFMRRSSWLYPDDGCFARAALMGQNLEKWKLPRPAKAFIFGNLSVKTPNSPTGSVSWWYHVVPIVMVGKWPVVLDPAINPDHPLFLKDWVMTMTSDVNSVKIGICDPTTYGPSSPCSVKSQDSMALSDQLRYLSEEWSRLVELKRDPANELGNNPPWGH